MLFLGIEIFEQKKFFDKIFKQDSEYQNNLLKKKFFIRLFFRH